MSNIDQEVLQMERNTSLDNPWKRFSAEGERQLYADTKGTSFSNVAVRHTVGTVGLLESTILPSISIQCVLWSHKARTQKLTSK